jgi:hypothetical protein
MSPLDAGPPRDPEPRKRVLPAVTDVVRELAKVVSADPAVLFKAARSVVGEELAKVKQGFEAAPLDVLVKRARFQLERDGTGIPVSEPTPPPMPVFPALPAPARKAPGPPPRPARPVSSEGPFKDLASRSDLNWEKDLPIQPDDAPFRSAILPIPHGSRGPLEISSPIEPVRDRRPAPAPLTFEPEPSPTPPPRAAAPMPPVGAPSPLTYVPDSEAPTLSVPPSSRETRPGPAGDPFEGRPAAPRPPSPPPAVASAPSIPLQHPRAPEPSETPSDPLPAPAPTGFELYLKSPSSPAAPPAARELPGPPPKAVSEAPPPTDPLDENTQPAMEEFHFKAPDPVRPPPVRSGRRGWLVAIALVLAVGAGLAWAVRQYVFKNEIVKSVAPIARKKPEEAPAVVLAPAPVPTSVPAVAAAAKPADPPAKPATALPKGKAALLLTPDWAGRPAVYVVHFSSTKDRESAAKEALKLGAALGAPARAVEVDLGEKGVWYRVVVGEFPDVDAARAFRAELEAKKTPGMGFVYEMRGR